MASPLTMRGEREHLVQATGVRANEVSSLFVARLLLINNDSLFVVQGWVVSGCSVLHDVVLFWTVVEQPPSSVCHQ